MPPQPGVVEVYMIWSLLVLAAEAACPTVSSSCVDMECSSHSLPMMAGEETCDGHAAAGLYEDITTTCTIPVDFQDDVQDAIDDDRQVWLHGENKVVLYVDTTSGYWIQGLRSFQYKPVGVATTWNEDLETLNAGDADLNDEADACWTHTPTTGYPDPELLEVDFRAVLSNISLVGPDGCPGSSTDTGGKVRWIAAEYCIEL